MGTVWRAAEVRTITLFSLVSPSNSAHCSKSFHSALEKGALSLPTQEDSGCI